MTRKQFVQAAMAAAVARPLSAQEDTRNRRWREDLLFLISELRRLHPDPFFRSSQADVERASEDLDQRIPELADHEVVVALARLLAMLGDGHTNVIGFPTGAGLRQYPLRLEWFPEGLYAIRGGQNAWQALGCKLVRIGETPVEEAWDKARPLISADNEWAVRSRMPSVLVSPEVLHALRLIPDLGPAAFTFARSSGEPLTVTLPVSGALTYAWPRLAKPVRLLFQQEAGLNYWLEYLEGSQALYIKYNACVADPMLPMPEFARQVRAFIEQRPVQRIVFDLRNNGGGDNTLIQPLMTALGEAYVAGVLAPSVLGFCIIGRQTASSGMWNAIDLKRTGVTLVGEPTGGKPNAPGNVQSVRLPNSQIMVNISTRMWSRFPEVGDQEALLPDLPVNFGVEDYQAQRDPFLEKALE
ncbi:MAG: hypothetical protein FJW34_20440 [Acidobacteria bacterium]|nr:hypothetical protein [Acidobacteriota bacterium]